MQDNIETIHDMYYGDGEFEFVKDNSTKEFLKSAHRAISLCELWNWMRIYEPHADKGFMWSKTPELDRLNQQMWKDPIIAIILVLRIVIYYEKCNISLKMDIKIIRMDIKIHIQTHNI